MSKSGAQEELRRGIRELENAEWSHRKIARALKTSACQVSQIKNKSWTPSDDWCSKRANKLSAALSSAAGAPGPTGKFKGPWTLPLQLEPAIDQPDETGASNESRWQILGSPSDTITGRRSTEMLGVPTGYTLTLACNRQGKSASCVQIDLGARCITQWSVDVPVLRGNESTLTSRWEAVTTRLSTAIERLIEQSLEEDEADEERLRETMMVSLRDSCGQLRIRLSRDGGVDLFRAIACSTESLPVLQVEDSESIAESPAGATWSQTAYAQVKQMFSAKPDQRFEVRAITFSVNGRGLERLGLPPNARLFLLVDDMFADFDDDTYRSIARLPSQSYVRSAASPERCQHAKSLLIRSLDAPDVWTLIVGSENLSGHGVEENEEHSLVLKGSGRVEPIRRALARFTELWDQGTNRKLPLRPNDLLLSLNAGLRRRATGHTGGELDLPVYQFDADRFAGVQRGCSDEIYRAFGEPGSATLLVLPPGTGKTLVAAHSLLRRATDVEDGGFDVAVWVSPTHVVVEQTLAQLRAMAEYLAVKVCLARYHSSCGLVDIASGKAVDVEELELPLVAVSNVHQWSRKGDEVLVRLRRRRIDFAIIDEAHHCGADATWRKVIDRLVSRSGSSAELKQLDDVCVLGLTATPWRLDDKPWLFDRRATNTNVVARSLREVREADLLGTPEIERPSCALPSMRVRVARGQEDYSSGFLRAVARHEPRNKDIVDRVVQEIHNTDSAQVLVFGATTEHCSLLERDLRARLESFRPPVWIAALHSNDDCTPAQHKELVDEFRRCRELSRPAILLNVQKFIEGFDVPTLDLVVLARPTLSHAYFLQMIGRGLRRRENADRRTTIVEISGTGNADSRQAVSLAEWDPPISDSAWRTSVRRQLLDATDLKLLVPSGDVDGTEWGRAGHGLPSGPVDDDANVSDVGRERKARNPKPSQHSGGGKRKARSKSKPSRKRSEKRPPDISEDPGIAW